MVDLARRPMLLIAVIGAAAAGLAVAWYLISPLFIRTMLTESSSAGSSQLVATGTFNEIDAVHRGSGTAQVFRRADGRLLVRFEDFSVTNGPDLHVILSRHAAPRDHAEATDGVNLGRLKASDGAFEYETDQPVDPADVKAVVIHCVAFRTVFSYATLD